MVNNKAKDFANYFRQKVQEKKERKLRDAIESKKSSMRDFKDF